MRRSSSRRRHASIATLLLTLIPTGTARADDGFIGRADVAVPVGFDGDVSATVLAEASGGAVFSDAVVRLRVPVLLRVDRPRLDLGNLLVQGAYDIGGLVLGAHLVVPTLWPADGSESAQAGSLTLASLGTGLAHAGRFVPATTGAGVDVALDFFDGDPSVVFRGGAEVLVSLAGEPVTIPVWTGVRIASAEELSSYLGASVGALIASNDFLGGSTLSAMGQVGVTASSDALHFDLGLEAGIGSTPEEPFLAVVTPRLIVTFGG